MGPTCNSAASRLVEKWKKFHENKKTETRELKRIFANNFGEDNTLFYYRYLFSTSIFIFSSDCSYNLFDCKKLLWMSFAWFFDRSRYIYRWAFKFFDLMEIILLRYLQEYINSVHIMKMFDQNLMFNLRSTNWTFQVTEKVL